LDASAIATEGIATVAWNGIVTCLETLPALLSALHRTPRQVLHGQPQESGSAQELQAQAAGAGAVAR